MVHKRVVAEVFPEPVRKLWSEWEMRTIILVSLALQISLVLVGGKRKYISSTRVKIFTWSAYLMADWAATVALGVLSTSNQGGDELRTFWAPFLLLHLGGPDTITAFSFADNELWIRHLLGVVVQTFVTIYVIITSWKRNSWISFLSIPMLVSGFIRYGERSWVLRSANQDEFLRESSVFVRKEMSEFEARSALRVALMAKSAALKFIDAAPRTELPTTDSDILKTIFTDAHKFFRTFKVLFVDIVVGLHGSPTLMYMKNKGSKSAYKLIEIELGYAYDTFFTKAPINYTRWGLFSRFFTSSLTIIVFVIFSFIVSATSNKFRTIDVVITFVLFGGAIILDVYSFLLLLSSDWTNLWLENHPEKTKVLKLISCLQFRQNCKSRWSKSMRQYNLLRFSLSQVRNPTGVLRVVPHWNKRVKKWVTEKIEDLQQLEIQAQVSDNLESLIFNHFQMKSDLESSVATLCALRGDGVLEKYSLLEELRWTTTNIDLDHSILIWHIATDICYCADANKTDSINREISKQLADYILYLLIKCPFMLPIGMGMLRFQDSCAEAIHVFNAESLEWKTGEVDSFEFRLKLLSSSWNVDAGKSVLTDACKLAKFLEEKMNIESEKWEMVCNVWVEILGYAANQCRGFYHAEKLAEGGELLTHVWFLMAHLGITQRFQY